MLRSFPFARSFALAAAVASFGAIGCANAGVPSTSSDGKTVIVARAEAPRRTNMFKGVKANTGYAIETVAADGRIKLAVSDDFVIPETPAPSWQVVDSQGNTYLLNQFKIKGGTSRSITLPAYIKDVQKVQVWCSYAEVLLGEASFENMK